MGIFRYFHHPVDEPPPKRCPLCDAWVSTVEPTFTPEAPRIRNAEKVYAVEDVYTAMERGNRATIEHVASITPGVSASDLNHMKITDSGPPNLVTSDNEVARRMQAMQQAGVPTGFGMATGSHNLSQFSNIPQSGMAIRDQIASRHWAVARAATSAGNQGVYRP